MFSDHTQWQKKIWNSAHNPINFKKPMFMGLRIEVVPDKNVQNICYMLPSPEFGDIKIPFEYSLSLVRKYKIKNNLNLTIIVKSRADVITNAPKNEQHAIETLREMITETAFRKYIAYGFILVKSKSDKTYQVFRNKAHTKVWKNGKLIEEVCVRIADCKIPPTDNVIAFKTLIEINENEFRKLGNVYNMAKVA